MPTPHAISIVETTSVWSEAPVCGAAPGCHSTTWPVGAHFSWLPRIVPLLIVTKLEQYDYVGATALSSVTLIASFGILLGVNLLQRFIRVIEACRAYGIAEPTFTEGSGAVTMTFKAEIVAGAGDLVPGGHQVGTKSALSPYQVQVLELADIPRALAELMTPRAAPTAPSSGTKSSGPCLRPACSK
jgi:hypothetical protein